MSEYPSDATRKLLNLFNESSQRSFLNSFQSENTFQKMEAEKKLKFSKTTLRIPWYLRIFTSVITNIAYASFKDGLSENSTDTITIRRPTPYSSVDGDGGTSDDKIN
jgi:hypothetical protein